MYVHNKIRLLLFLLLSCYASWGTATAEEILVYDKTGSDFTVTVGSSECGEISSATYAYGTGLTIYADPVRRHRFVQWSDGNKSNPRHYTVLQDASFIAQYEDFIAYDTVTVNQQRGGTVSGEGVYERGDTCRLIATPDERYIFECWNDGVKDNPRIFAVNGDVQLSPSFSLIQHHVVINTNGCEQIDSLFYDGALIHLTFVPDYGYHFQRWSDGNTENPRTLVVSQDTALTAEYERNTYTLSVSSNDVQKGTVTGGGDALYLDTLQVSATPVGQYLFHRWSDGVTEPTREIVLTKDSNLVAYFGLETVTVTVLAENGMVSGAGVWEIGSSVTLTATPNTGYRFLRWGDGNTDNPRTITVTSDTTLTAKFELEAFATGSAEVLSTSGRTSCVYVQLWEGGPRWATFNVGATITDYARITVNADATTFVNYKELAPYYNTANVGGLYPWNNPNKNGRKTTWNDNVVTGIADVATTLWGENWLTPTNEQLDTLMNSEYGKTQWTWCDGSSTQYVSGCTLVGYKVSGVGAYADKSIFIPAAGNFGFDGYTLGNVSFDGLYWSSTMYDTDRAYYMEFYSARVYTSHCFKRIGQSVRAILAEDAVGTPIYTVVVKTNEEGWGTVTGGGYYEKDVQVTLTATPNLGYHFVQWSDGNTDTPRTITVTSDITLTAVFERDVTTGSADVLNSSGRSSCEWVQLWENGPKWATFNVGATINHYASLTYGADSLTIGDDFIRISDTDQAPYYNTANVGGLYAWNQPSYNGRQKTWEMDVATGAADVATTLWGSNWRTPTREQLDTLQNSELGKTIWTWCDGSSTQYVTGCTLKGYKVSGVGAYEDNSIFLPAAGHFYNNDRVYEGASDNGFYWANTLYDSEHAYYLRINSYNREVAGDISYGHDCRDGRSVRAVLDDGFIVYTIMARPNNFLYGTVIGCGTYVEGSQVSLTAKPASRYQFVRWSDGNTENPRTIIVTEDISLTAEFAKIEYEYVDLGLPSGTLWATMNLGAKTVFDYGDYFSWGETSPKTSYRWSDYKYGKAEDALTKYCVSPEYSLKGIPDNKTKLEPEDDAATAILGGAWHTPTDDEWKELFGCCYVHREEDRFVLTSRFNKWVLYLPCAGYWLGNWNDFTGMICAYWSSNLYEKVCYDANGITVYDQMRPLHMLRHCGLPVRAVRKADNKQSPSMTEDLNTTLQESQVIKRMVNGQLFIIRDGNAYNMQGQRVE